MQHENDHLNGILYTDYVDSDKLFDADEFFEKNEMPEPVGTWKLHKGHASLENLNLLSPPPNIEVDLIKEHVQQM